MVSYILKRLAATLPVMVVVALIVWLPFLLEVLGGIETVNGAIGLVDTDVSGGIETVNGDVTVGVSSHVRGGLHFGKQNKQFLSFGKPRIPRVIIGPDARVDGPLHFEREVVLYVHATAKTGAITGAKAIRFDTPTPPEQ